MIVSMARTNVVLNDELMAEAERLSGARSKSAVIEDALRTYVRVKNEERRRASWRERVSRLDTRTAKLRLARLPTAVLRQDRERL